MSGGFLIVCGLYCVWKEGDFCHTTHQKARAAPPRCPPLRHATRSRLPGCPLTAATASPSHGPEQPAAQRRRDAALRARAALAGTTSSASLTATEVTAV